MLISRFSTSRSSDCRQAPSSSITDCDSVLSSGIAAGHLEPLKEYGEAAIAADHTGEENEIADLLQALDHQRDPHLSFTSLSRLTAGLPLGPVAQEALDERRRKREQAAQLVSNQSVTVTDGLAFGVLPEAIDGEFFPALVPHATVILLASRMKDPRRWQMKIRLGNAAPAGLTLHALGIGELDLKYGGRWNAGSNKRGGGTELTPQAYFDYIRERLKRCSSRSPESHGYATPLLSLAYRSSRYGVRNRRLWRDAGGYVWNGIEGWHGAKVPHYRLATWEAALRRATRAGWTVKHFATEDDMYRWLDE